MVWTREVCVLASVLHADWLADSMRLLDLRPQSDQRPRQAVLQLVTVG